MKHCARSDDSLRAWFTTKEEAEAFIRNPANIEYQDDVVVFCGRCGFFHCSHPAWLEFRPWETRVENLAVN